MLLLGSSCLGPRVQTEIVEAHPAFLRGGFNGKKVFFAPMLPQRKLSYIPNEVQFHLMQSELETRFHEKHPHTQVIVADELEKAVEGISLSKLIADSAVIPMTAIQLQHLRQRGVDYLWVSLLQSNEEGNDTSEWTEETITTAEDFEGNETKTSVTTYTSGAHACRRMVVACYLYEVASGKRVWAAVSRDQRCHLNWVESNRDYLPAPAFPSAPRETELMENIVKDLMKKLP